MIEAGLAESDWLAGEFSLADIAYVPHLMLIEEGGFDLGAYPRLRAWLARLQSRPAWRRVAEMILVS